MDRTGDAPAATAPPLSPAEALMWAVERDPLLRSAFMNVTICEGRLDIVRLRRRMALAVVAIPRLRQRIVPSGRPFEAPRWVDDPDFDLDHHVRRVALARPGRERDLLDLAADLFEDAFDPARPLWLFTVVEGLAGGRSALLSKMHHTLTDGVGGVRLSAMFIDLSADQTEPLALAPKGGATQGDGADTGSPGGWAGAVLRPIGLARSVAGAVAAAATHPLAVPADVMGATRAALSTLFESDPARSPLWRGKRSLSRHFEVLSVDLDAVKTAGHRLGGTVNDVFVTGVAGGLGAYHRGRGAEVDELRMSMPVSTRTDRSAGGNAFLPTRILVPTGPMPVAARLALVQARVAAAKGGGEGAGLTVSLAGVAAGLPPALVARVARQQTATVDFVGSNVRGAPFDVWIGGAKILANHPMGPLGGTALSITVLSTGSHLDFGLNCDPAAIDDPAGVRTAVADGMAEVLAAGVPRPRRRPRPGPH